MDANNAPVVASDTSKKIKPKLVWDNTTFMVFIDLCMNEVKLGNRPGSHFNKVGWGNIEKKIKEWKCLVSVMSSLEAFKPATLRRWRLLYFDQAGDARSINNSLATKSRYLTLFTVQQATQEAKEALMQGLEALNQSLSDTIASDALSSPTNMLTTWVRWLQP
ncbi:Myb/SANT-like domain-containing protein [Cynara cardunculus var. scolymus]|uniref:Myb/SANT-like domain-containing protein n=1 Tax=Cynara cardunculus var. scolymus TaxID=59895 RepID=A0A118K507_CYNCS|nr:Myb/SANT-like domain-containing protein [Cynara cardunculus var. scolymus]